MTLVNLIQSVPAVKVFLELGAGIPTDLHDAMDSLCQFVWETTPRTYRLSGMLHRALLIHWRVHAHLVSWRCVGPTGRSLDPRGLTGAPCPATGCDEFWAAAQIQPLQLKGVGYMYEPPNGGGRQSRKPDR